MVLMAIFMETRALYPYTDSKMREGYWYGEEDKDERTMRLRMMDKHSKQHNNGDGNTTRLKGGVGHYIKYNNQHTEDESNNKSHA